MFDYILIVLVMKLETKRRTYNALTTAAEMIRQHVELGLMPEDVGEKNENGLKEYAKACERAQRLIENLAKRYI